MYLLQNVPATIPGFPGISDTFKLLIRPEVLHLWSVDHLGPTKLLLVNGMVGWSHGNYLLVSTCQTALKSAPDLFPCEQLL